MNVDNGPEKGSLDFPDVLCSGGILTFQRSHSKIKAKGLLCLETAVERFSVAIVATRRRFLGV